MSSVRRRAGAASVSAAIAIAGAASAQPVVLDPIILDAETSEPDVFDIRESVTILGSDALERDRAAQDVETALRLVPNVNILGTSNGFVNIRGENSEGPGNAAFGLIPGAQSPTPVTIDGRPLSFGELTFGTSSLFDVDFIEVVRGPQTTAGGLNGAIGAVNVITRDPTFEFQGEGRAEAFSFEGRQFSAVVSGPLAGDELAGRFAIDFRRRDTYIDYTAPNRVVIDDSEQFEQFTARAKLLWAPSNIDNLRVRFTYNYTESSGPQTEIVNVPVEDLERTTNPFPAAFLTEAQSFILDAEYDLSDALTLSNKFSFADFEVKRRNAPESGFKLDQDGRDFTNELTATYDPASGPWSAVSGIFLRYQEDDNDWDFFGPSDYSGERFSLGLYGEATYEITEQLRVTAGLRYQLETQDREGNLFTEGNPTELDFDQSDDAILPRLAIEYDVTPDTRIGAFVARGFTPGGFTFAAEPGTFGDGVTPQLLPEFDAETRWTYEAFIRSRFLENRLEIAANVFYNQIDDVQLLSTTFLPDGSAIGVVLNGDEARSYGLEVQADFQATDRLSVAGSLGLLDTEIVSFDASAEDVEGNELEEAPSVTAAFSADFEIIDDLSIGGTVSYTSSYFSDFGNTDAEEVPDRTIVDLRASYSPTERIEIFGYVNNVFDVVEPTFLFASGGPFFSGGTTPPRVFGLGASVSF